MGSRVFWRRCRIVKSGFHCGASSREAAQQRCRERDMSCANRRVALAIGGNSGDEDICEVAILPRVGRDAVLDVCGKVAHVEA